MTIFSLCSKFYTYFSILYVFLSTSKSKNVTTVKMPYEANFSKNLSNLIIVIITIIIIIIIVIIIIIIIISVLQYIGLR